VAFDAGNLVPAAEALKRKFPQAAITLCADNDHHLEKNVGLNQALKAALAVGGRVLIPGFTEDERGRGLTDWNDLAQSRGITAVIKEIKACRTSDRHRKEAPAARPFEWR